MFNTKFDIEKIRGQFPALNQIHEQKKPIFFDGPGGSQVPQKVLDAIVDYLSSGNANLGGAYFSSKQTDRLLNNARCAAADLYNAASEDEIIFGANATSLAFSMSRVIANTWEKGDEVIVTDLDHYSNVSPWEIVAKERGAILNNAPIITNDCSLDTEALVNLVTEKTKLIAVTYASNVTGSIVDLSNLIAEIRRKSEALIYVDAVHLVPHQKVDVQSLDCDFLVSSAYKYFGPHIGVLYAKQKYQNELTPYKVAPAKNANPNRWETGTQSFEALAGLTATIDYLASLSSLKSLSNKNISRRDRLENSYSLIKTWEEDLNKHFLTCLNKFDNITLYGRNSTIDRTPTFAIRIKNIEPHLVSAFFAKHYICIGDGNLYAHGLYEQLQITEKGGVIRIGLMHYNEKSEIDVFFKYLTKCIEEYDLSN